MKVQELFEVRFDDTSPDWVEKWVKYHLDNPGEFERFNLMNLIISVKWPGGPLTCLFDLPGMPKLIYLSAGVGFTKLPEHMVNIRKAINIVKHYHFDDGADRHEVSQLKSECVEHLFNEGLKEFI